MNFRPFCLSAFFSVLAIGNAFASGTNATTAAAADLVKGITHGQLHLQSTFKGPGPDVVGVIAQNAAGQKCLPG